MVVVGAAFAAACSGDDGAAPPSVPTSAVPRAEPAVGTDQPVTLVDESCLRTDDLTLVFVIEPAEWATEPPDGCEGPYFLVTGFDVQPG